MDMNRKLNDEDLDDSDDSDSSEDEENVEEESEFTLTSPSGHPHIAAFKKNSDSSDSSQDSNDEDVEMETEVDEDALQQELKTVVDKLLSEPYSYDLYLEKIRILKALGDLDGLRNTREKMSSLYPLSPALWIDWIKDEEKLISDEEEKERVISLMDRAVKDYSSVEVWLEYINFWLIRLQEEKGVDRCRDVFERALASCGLHVSMGSLIWDAYKDFEAALLATKTTEDEMAEQEKRYIGLCRRQLSVPLLDMKSSYKQIKAKIDIDNNTEAAYSKAVQRLKELQTWEAQLIQSSDDYQKTQVYKSYIEDEKKAKSNPARVQCLYERALTDIPLEVTLWTEYIEYLSKSLKIPEVILGVAERASRNCPWIISIWTKYMWVIETFSTATEDTGEDIKRVGDGGTCEKMRNVFEKAVIYCGTAEQAGTLWLKYLEFLRRSLNHDAPDLKTLQILRKTFTAAEEHLLQLVEEPNDYISQILQFKSRFETKLANSMTLEVVDMWKDIFHRGYGQNFRVWVQYISQQIKYGGDVKKIRSELSRGMSYVKDDPTSMADLWLNFERDNGDLTSMINCEAKISKELEKVTTDAGHQQSYPNYPNYLAPVTFVKGQKENRAQARKRKFELEGGGSSVPLKKGRGDKDAVDAGGTPGRSEVKVVAGFKMPSLPQGRKVNEEKAKVDGEESDQRRPEKKGEPVKHDSSKDHRTVFVSNLDFNTNEEGLKGFFETCGKVEDIRLVRDFKGRSKGFGYVFFENGDSVGSALGKDRSVLDSRPVFVSKCDADKSTRQAQFKYPTALEKSKIFLKGLPLETTVEELKEMFGKFGTINDCRLVTHRNGHSKGLAYIDFEKEANASAAIIQMDGTKILDQVISVSISNPPTKNAPNTSQRTHTNKFAPSRSEPDQRRSRNMFVPRALQVQPSGGDGTSKAEKSSDNSIPAANNIGGKPGPKSNDDFRKLFMKQ